MADSTESKVSATNAHFNATQPRFINLVWYLSEIRANRIVFLVCGTDGVATTMSDNTFFALIIHGNVRGTFTS